MDLTHTETNNITTNVTNPIYNSRKNYLQKQDKGNKLDISDKGKKLDISDKGKKLDIKDKID